MGHSGLLNRFMDSNVKPEVSPYPIPMEAMGRECSVHSPVPMEDKIRVETRDKLYNKMKG